MRRFNQIVHAQGFLLPGIGKRVEELDVSCQRPFPTKGSKPPLSPHPEPRDGAPLDLGSAPAKCSLFPEIAYQFPKNF